MSKLKVGVGREIITPKVGTYLFGYEPREAKRVNDDLRATAVVFEQDGVKSLLINVEVLYFETETANAVKALIEKEVGIKHSNIILAATHTHSGPCLSGNKKDCEYLETVFTPGCLNATKKAVATLQNAIMGIGTSRCDIAVNRREILENGSVALGQNPWGPYNPIMTCVAFKNEADEPILNMICYGMHSTASACNYEITRDWSGIMLDRLEFETGATSIFLCGAEGDIGPRLINGRTTGIVKKTQDRHSGLQYAMELGGRATYSAMEAYSNVKEYNECDMQVICDTIRLPYAKPITLEEAKAEFAKYPEDGDHWDFIFRNHYKSIINGYENNYFPENLELQQTIIKIGNLAIVPFPFEVFSEIELRLQKYSPVPYTITLSNADGYYAYLPTQSQFINGGYEVKTFRLFNEFTLEENTDTTIIGENLRLLRKLCEK